MSRINAVQKSICELDGGTFQKLLDAYLYKKYKFDNIQSLGVQTATNKTTKGTPDSFVIGENGKYTLIMYGSVEAIPYKKLEADILSCFNMDKLQLEEDKIEKIICAYTSTNLRIEQIEKLKNIVGDVELEMIGLATISHDLVTNYPYLASEYLNIPIDTEQIFTSEKFIEVYDKNGMNAPLNMPFWGREEERKKLIKSIANNMVTMVSGVSGVGKTRFVMEACNDFEKDGWNVFCVKNNGELLYNDIKYYISEVGEYILFIDDANYTTSLEYILNYVQNPPEGMTIKVIMTVRDYAKTRVRNVVCKHLLPVEIHLLPLTNEEIKKILSSNLEINNEDYLKRIIKIAEGNIRLAILAGKLAIDKGYLAINNAMDIFDSYYGEVIRNQEMNDSTIKLLFVIALLGPIRFVDNDFAYKIFEQFQISESDFIETCHRLNESEIVDLYQDEIVKVSDQSFGNYILEYCLYQKKHISICDLLILGFPKYKNKLVYALSTVMALFNTKEVKKYIKSQVNESWALADVKQEMEYIKCFYPLNEEKSLALLKKQIDNAPANYIDLSAFDFSKDDYKNINTDEIIILSGFKYSKYYIEAVELLLKFFDKRPDLVMEFYYAFTDSLFYDTNSHKLDYNKEHELLKCIYENCDAGKNINCTVLMLNVIKKFLKCDISITEKGDSIRSITFIRFNVVFTEGSQRLREYIWNILAELYDNKLYKEKVEEILAANRNGGDDKEEMKKIALFDWNCINKLFVSKWKEISFEQCVILNDIEKNMKWLGIDADDTKSKCITNEDFVVYKTIIRERVKGKTRDEAEREKMDEIQIMIDTFDIDELRNMFKILSSIEGKKSVNCWEIQSGISMVFYTQKSEKKKYVKTVECYLEAGAPFSINPGILVYNLLNFIGISTTKDIISKYEYKGRSQWMCEFFQLLPPKEIKKTDVDDLITFVSEEIDAEMSFIPDVEALTKYSSVDNDIVVKISNILLKDNEKGTQAIRAFMGMYFGEGKINLLFGLYENKIEILEDLYLAAVGNYFDYDGELLKRLSDKSVGFWGKFTSKLKGAKKGDSYSSELFNWAWSSKNYMKLIDVAVKRMVEEELSFMVEWGIELIFADNDKASDEVKERKSAWLKSYIIGNSANDVKLKLAFYIIVKCLPSEKTQFILLLLDKNKNIETFKKIPLEPSMMSWSGSEVPLIEKQIGYLDKLLSALRGGDYIEHCAYLVEERDKLEKYEKSVLIREYLEETDLA